MTQWLHWGHLEGWVLLILFVHIIGPLLVLTPVIGASALGALWCVATYGPAELQTPAWQALVLWAEAVPTPAIQRLEQAAAQGGARGHTHLAAQAEREVTRVAQWAQARRRPAIVRDLIALWVWVQHHQIALMLDRSTPVQEYEPSWPAHLP